MGRRAVAGARGPVAVPRRPRGARRADDAGRPGDARRARGPATSTATRRPSGGGAAADRRLGAGTAVAVAAIVVIAMNLGGSPAATHGGPDAAHADRRPRPRRAVGHPVARRRPPPRRRRRPRPPALAAVRRAVRAVLRAAGRPLAGRGLPVRPEQRRLHLDRRRVRGRRAGQRRVDHLVRRGVLGAAARRSTATPAPPTCRASRRTWPRPSPTPTTARCSTTPPPSRTSRSRSSGHAGWEVTYDITYTNAAAQGATWTDEQAAVVVVDTGTGDSPRCSSPRSRRTSTRATSPRSSRRCSSPRPMPAASGTPAGTATDTSANGGTGFGSANP